MISYHSIEIQAMMHLQELGRESAMAALAARVARPVRPGFLQWLARGLRAFAYRIEPGCDPAPGRTALTAFP